MVPARVGSMLSRESASRIGMGSGYRCDGVDGGQDGESVGNEHHQVK